jgi:hypothetical protein
VERETYGDRVVTAAPRWICRDEKDQQRLEAWTNAQLDAIDAVFEAAYDPARDPFYIFHPTLAALEEENAQRVKRGRVILAARAGDHETLARLADTLELRRLAFKRHRRGREKGERRPRDLPQVTKVCCEDALDDVEHIRRIWKREYGRQNRGADSPPTAMGIAARRHGIEDETTLINFKKNRHRKRL